MSADNGVYILKTLRPPIKDGNCYINSSGHEYRVAHCQAIENIDYSDLYLPILFGRSPIFPTQEAANQFAVILAKEIEYLEYGICLIEKECYFPNLKPETAAHALDCYLGAEPI